MVARLKEAGIGPGLHPSKDLPAGPLRDGLLEGVDKEHAELPGRVRADVLAAAAANGGWYVPPARIGDYGRDFDLRAAIAVVGLGANTPQEAVYPSAITDSEGRLLDGRRSYRLVFPRGQLPPDRAFWSLTMYDIDGYLVANDSGRYAIGDSHPPLRKRADGAVEVAVQAERPADPDVNWLPPPAGLFRLNLRIYAPRPAALNGDWKPPPVELVP
jgi:hypothetical protein